MSRSVIVHLVAPAGSCSEPLPRKYIELHFATTREVGEFDCSVKSQPCDVTVPTPLASTTPPQQTW